ncbi:hypothetical protein GY24_10425, partial [Microterricola pindariensis]
MKRPQGIEHTAKAVPSTTPERPAAAAQAAPPHTPASAPRKAAARRVALPTAWWLNKPAAGEAPTAEAVTEPI